MTKTRILTPLAIAASAVAILPATAQARSSYCSPSGDLCYGVVKGSSPIKLRITLQAKYFKRYRLCIRGPNGQRNCHRFRIKRLGNGLYGSTIRVGGEKFPFQGKGTYRARYSTGGESLGPAITY
jgi:hypothetical protein